MHLHTYLNTPNNMYYYTKYSIPFYNFRYIYLCIHFHRMTYIHTCMNPRMYFYMKMSNFSHNLIHTFHCSYHHNFHYKNYGILRYNYLCSHQSSRCNYSVRQVCLKVVYSKTGMMAGLMMYADRSLYILHHML